MYDCPSMVPNMNQTLEYGYIRITKIDTSVTISPIQFKLYTSGEIIAATNKAINTQDVHVFPVSVNESIAISQSLNSLRNFVSGIIEAMVSYE